MFVDQFRCYINGSARPVLSPPISCMPNTPIYLRLSVVCFLPLEVGDFSPPSYVSMGGE